MFIIFRQHFKIFEIIIEIKANTFPAFLAIEHNSLTKLRKESVPHFFLFQLLSEN